jgi:hypothetical protein
LQFFRVRHNCLPQRRSRQSQRRLKLLFGFSPSALPNLQLGDRLFHDAHGFLQDGHIEGELCIGCLEQFAGDTALSKCCFNSDWPAGLGALAMTVRPPPATAPATTVYLRLSVNPGTRVLR